MKIMLSLFDSQIINDLDKKMTMTGFKHGSFANPGRAFGPCPKAAMTIR